MPRAERYPDVTLLRAYAVPVATRDERVGVAVRFVNETPGKGRKRGWEVVLATPSPKTGRQVVGLKYLDFTFPRARLGMPRAHARRDGYSVAAWYLPWRGELTEFKALPSSQGRLPPPDDLMLLEMHLLPATMDALNALARGETMPSYGLPLEAFRRLHAPARSNPRRTRDPALSELESGRRGTLTVIGGVWLHQRGKHVGTRAIAELGPGGQNDQPIHGLRWRLEIDSDINGRPIYLSFSHYRNKTYPIPDEADARVLADGALEWQGESRGKTPNVVDRQSFLFDWLREQLATLPPGSYSIPNLTAVGARGRKPRGKHR